MASNTDEPTIEAGTGRQNIESLYSEIRELVRRKPRSRDAQRLKRARERVDGHAGVCRVGRASVSGAGCNRASGRESATARVSVPWRSDLCVRAYSCLLARALRLGSSWVIDTSASRPTVVGLPAVERKA